VIDGIWFVITLLLNTENFMYYLKLTGVISKHNQPEFEQTFRIFSNDIPAICSGYLISKDILRENMYHFISYWPNLEELESFVKSRSYNLLAGSFKTLGELNENSSRKLVSF
jgi:hypothetical protein